MFPCNKLATPTTKETGNHRIPRTHSQVLFQEARNLVFSSANQMHRGWPQTKRAKPKGGTTTPDKMPNSHPEMSVHILKISDRIKDNISPSTLGLFDSVTEEIEGKQVIKVLVSSGLEKPYYIKRNGMSPSGCYKRVGTSTLPMPTAMIDALYSRRIHTTLRNIKSPRQDLEFAQLMIYYQQKKIRVKRPISQKLGAIYRGREMQLRRISPGLRKRRFHESSEICRNRQSRPPGK